MRTTIELPADSYSTLLALASRRGEKELSRLVEEAVERYLEVEEERLTCTEAAVSALGSLGAEEAERMRESIPALRDPRSSP